MNTKLPTGSGYFAKYVAYGGIIALITIPVLVSLLREHFDGPTVFVVIITLVMVILAPTVGYDVVRYIKHKERLKNRAQRIAASLGDIRFLDGGGVILTTPMFEALGSGDGGQSTFLGYGSGWSFMDYAFNKVVRNKGSSYVSSRYHFSVVQINLPRKLPHMVFDSKQVKGSQMRFKFDRDQRLSLEGDFDTYFDTYVPAHYYIDTLSIITPVIMEALVAAHSFDIEIQGNTLNLYAPHLPPEKVADMVRRGFFIRDKLMNNINNYTDKRLAEASKGNVHVAGLTIQKNFKCESALLIGNGLFIGALSLLSLPRIEPTLIETLWGISFEFIFLAIISVILIIGGVAVLKKGYAERAQRLDANRPTPSVSSETRR